MCLVSAAASAAAEPCTANAKGALVCGTGDDALTVLSDTRSPSGTYAVGWRLRPGTPRSDQPAAGDVEEHLVRLPDGHVLGPVVGRAWNDGEMQSNKIDLVTAWSPDERWLLVGDVGQEHLVDIAVYAIDASKGVLNAQPLLEALTAAAKPKLAARVGQSNSDEYELQLPYPAVISITDAGAVTLPLMFHIPKQDERQDLKATFTVSLGKAGISTTPVKIRFKT